MLSSKRPFRRTAASSSDQRHRRPLLLHRLPPRHLHTRIKGEPHRYTTICCRMLPGRRGAPMRVFGLLVTLLLAACSWSNRPDCVFGIRSDGCAPGTVGYQQAQEAQAQAAAAVANDDARCRSYGVEPGSPGYAQCRMNMDNLRAQDEQQRRALAVQYLMAHPIGGR
jgi:hypothetical protein